MYIYWILGCMEGPGGESSFVASGCLLGVGYLLKWNLVVCRFGVWRLGSWSPGVRCDGLVDKSLTEGTMGLVSEGSVELS